MKELDQNTFGEIEVHPHGELTIVGYMALIAVSGIATHLKFMNMGHPDDLYPLLHTALNFAATGSAAALIVEDYLTFNLLK